MYALLKTTVEEPVRFTPPIDTDQITKPEISKCLRLKLLHMLDIASYLPQTRAPMIYNYMTRKVFNWRHIVLCGVHACLCVKGFR